MYASCVRQLGHNLPNAMHRWQKHTNSWEKGHFDALNHVVKALEYRVTCFLQGSAFFYTHSTRKNCMAVMWTNFAVQEPIAIYGGFTGSFVRKSGTSNARSCWRELMKRLHDLFELSFVFLENSHDFAKLIFILHRWTGSCLNLTTS